MLFRFFVLAALFVAQDVLAQPGLRITGGEEAPPHQYPWQVSIAWKLLSFGTYKPVCSGSILNENWVLTTGHCVKSPIGHFAVQAGKHILNEKEDGQQISKVEQKVIHWNYKGILGENNIALLKLKTPLVFNENVAAIKLPVAGSEPSGDAVISGWGSTSTTWKPEIPTVLQTATVKIIGRQECYDALHELPGDIVLTNKQLCTGPRESGISTCVGDGGGPLTKYDAAGEAELVGVINYAPYPCGAGNPSVYAKVSSFIPWINEKILS